MNEQIKRIDLEFAEFKNSMLKKSPQEIFDSCGQIYFYEEVSEYLKSSDIPLHDKVTLKSLYNLYITNMSSYYSVGCWDDTDVFVREAIDIIK